MTALIGWWYATGPSDQPYSPTNPEFHHHTVVAEEVEGLAGRGKLRRKVCQRIKHLPPP